jgi:integrase
LEVDELENERLQDYASALDRIIFLLLSETGLEIDNLITLRVSDLNIETGQLQVSKEKKIQLSCAVLSEIRAFLLSRPGQVYLLEGRCGKPVTSKWKRCVLEKQSIAKDKYRLPRI